MRFETKMNFKIHGYPHIWRKSNKAVSAQIFSFRYSEIVVMVVIVVNSIWTKVSLYNRLRIISSFCGSKNLGLGFMFSEQMESLGAYVNQELFGLL